MFAISGDLASNESSDFSSPGSMIEECVDDAGLRLGERSRLHIAELNCKAIWNGILDSNEHCLLAFSNSLKLDASVGILQINFLQFEKKYQHTFKKELNKMKSKHKLLREQNAKKGSRLKDYVRLQRQAVCFCGKSTVNQSDGEVRRRRVD